MIKNIEHNVEFCVIGGGLAGICAAIAAAREGLKVALMHERPMLGGNASSEIRMWVCGAVGKDNRETGIIEEIMLENRYRNPYYNYSIWDSILYEKVRFEPNITLLLNCSCNDAKVEEGTIKSIKGWQLTTQTWHTVKAELFADCSGDSILANLTGADYCLGRESSDKYGESLAPETADRNTMGMSCLMQVRETTSPKKFTPPKWAYKYHRREDLSHRSHALHEAQNFWWIEVGGQGYEAILDTEKVRDELLKIVFGVWDHIKNHGDHGAENWQLEWVGFLPGKRESRRYKGDYILTQNDINLGADFEDTVAYGGWPIDDHHPAGFYHDGEATEFHGVYAPFKIPYRCLYSRNVSNLFFAGRNISVSHVALASTRVMATCATLGQAIGLAAAIAINEKSSPRGVYQKHIETLQNKLLDSDCCLPGLQRQISDICQNAQISSSDPEAENVRSGIERTANGFDNIWVGDLGGYIEYSFEKPEFINSVRLVFDSDLNRSIIDNGEPELAAVSYEQEQQGYEHNYNNGLVSRQDSKLEAITENDPARTTVREMRSCYPLGMQPQFSPSTLIKAFKIEAIDKDRNCRTVINETNNYQRLYKAEIGLEAAAIRFIPLKTWGDRQARVFAFEVS